MVMHYLTLAVRNLLKYKTQSLVSIFGLAVGEALKENCPEVEEAVTFNTYDAFMKVEGGNVNTTTINADTTLTD